MLTALEGVFTLLEQTSSELATSQGMAVLVYAIGEVLAGHADHTAFPFLQASLVNEVPLLHNPPHQYVCTSNGNVNTAALSPKENLLPYTSTGSC